MRQIGCHFLHSVLLMALLAAPSAGQTADAPENADAEPVIRFTPDMARGLARRYARQVLARRYEIDEQKADELAEPVARRIMAMAHTMDGQGGELVEYVMTQALRAQAEGRQSAGMTPEFAKGVAQRLLPLLPAVRDLVREVGNDIRPQLPLKQQLKLMGDMAIAGTAINAFEQNLQRWERGEVNPYEDPFRPQEAPQKEADGTSKELKRARKTATGGVEAAWREWAGYVEDAKKFYDLDPSQGAMADSLLREYTERAVHQAADPSWRDRVYRNRLWAALMQSSRMANANPLWFRLEDELPELTDPISRLELELKQRIDEIPTGPQREAAERKVIQALSGQSPSGTAEAGR